MYLNMGTITFGSNTAITITTTPHKCKHTLTKQPKMQNKTVDFEWKNPYIFHILIPSTAVSVTLQMCAACRCVDPGCVCVSVCERNSVCVSGMYRCTVACPNWPTQWHFQVLMPEGEPHTDTHTHMPTLSPDCGRVAVNEKANINCKSSNGHELQFPAWRPNTLYTCPSHHPPPHACFPPRYIKGTEPWHWT